MNDRHDLWQGIALMSTPFWASLFHAVHNVLSEVAVVCGAFIGLHGVYRIIRAHWKR